MTNNVGTLTNCSINRYSRQIILPHVGVNGQLLIQKTSVLLVGAGGLGCPCGLYLAGAGVGHIGLVDYDEVELNNLHRQILHKESAIGVSKVESAKGALTLFNSNTKISTYKIEINSSNALQLIEQYDIIVDCSDNVATRYLLNDACFLQKKPLVSGSALQMDGQLTVYHHGNDGPCYRCLFPIPPHPSTVTNCGDGGVLGVIPGTIGVLQALQVLNIILNQPTLAGFLMLFDGVECSFRRVKLRNRLAKCTLCGDNPTINSLIDYEQFCSAKANDKNPNLKLLEKEQRISPKEYAELKETPHVLLDVRNAQEFAICSLPNSINLPINKIQSGKGKQILGTFLPADVSVPVIVVCRRGNDSQKAVTTLQEELSDYTFRDITGGLHAWSADIDNNFPVY